MYWFAVLGLWRFGRLIVVGATRFGNGASGLSGMYVWADCGVTVACDSTALGTATILASGASSTLGDVGTACCGA